MLENIVPYKSKYYTYGDYVFYRNSNYIKRSSTESFPNRFYMAGYNDEKRALIFLQMCTPRIKLDKKYRSDIEGNFTEFIDEYYGEFYDFKA